MFDFTREERGVVLFVISIAVVGLGISVLVKNNAPVRRITYISQEIAKINLNSADKQTLMLIPGVGEKTAERIIQRRDELGAFKDIEELRSLRGINKRNFSRIKELACTQDR